MAESYSVKAILSATDSGFSSTLKGASSAVESFASKVKSGFTFGLLTGAGQAAFNALTNGAKSLIGEIDASNAAWKTFEGNMGMLGKSSGEIDSVKKELQSFAEQTVYSSSDMAQTFAQLEAVGVKNTTSLVKGFGGLAAAAENPQQAMKTLSTQATQMAAKPSVAWADFKLMLEQTPAGIAAIAKHMGMSTAEMVTAVQEGEIATDEFFDAISAVGTNDAFSKLATESKTVGQAMDGLKETIGNKLTPAFDMLSQIGIDAINGIAEKLGDIDGEEIKNKVAGWIEQAKPYWESFKEVAADVGNAIKAVGGFLSEHSEEISKALPYVVKIVAAFKGFQLVKSLVPGMTMFTKGIASLAGKGIGAIAGKLLGISGAQTKVGGTSATSGAQMLTAAKSYALMGVAVLAIAAGFALLAFSAISLANAGGLAIGVMAGLVIGVVALGVGMALLLKSLAPMSGQLMPVATAFLAMGAAVLLVSAGFALLAATSIALANAGGGAIAVMVGMVAVIALLAIGAAALAPALTAGAVGLIAFGAALTLIGVAAVLAATALVIVSTVLPTICEYGLQGAGAIAALGAGMLAFAAGAALAGAAAIVLGAGLAVVAIGIAAVGVAVLVLSAGILVLAAGLLVAAASLALLATQLPIIAQYGTQGATAIVALSASMIAFAAGAAVAGAACVVLGAGLAVVGAGLLVVAAAVLVAAAGVLALSAGVLVLAAGCVALGAGLLVVGAALTLIAAVLPATAAGSLALGAGFTLLLATSAGLSALLIALTATMAALMAGSIAATATVAAFGAAMLVASAGTLVMAAALKGVNSSMKTIAKNAKSAESSLTSMQSSVSVVEAGLDALGNKAKSAMKAVTQAFDDTAKDAKKSGEEVGKGFTESMKAGLQNAPSVATQAVTAVNTTLRAGYSSAYSAGAYISQGFAAGMLSCLGTIQSAAAQMAAAADAAVRAKAKIHSPSKVSESLGEYWGEGFVGGIANMVKDAWREAENLVSIPNLATPNLAMAYSGGMSDEYEYYSNSRYTVEVPLTLDGKQVAKATATYTQEELDKLQRRENRKQGRV